LYTHPQDGGYCQSKRVSKEEREDSCTVYTHPQDGDTDRVRESVRRREDSCTHILRTGDIDRVRESVRRRERTVVHTSSGRGY
jgi:hypothetical protein